MSPMWWMLVLACSEPPRSIDAAKALEGVASRGEPQFQMVCALCHGRTGQGVSRTPALAGRVHELSDDELLSAMIQGRGAMSRTRLNDQQAADVLAYLRQTFPAPAEGAP